MRGIESTTKMSQYVVRSSVHMMNLDNALSRLLGQEQFIDVTLACDGHKFQCHRLILAASSPLFEELLMDNPTTHPIVILPHGIKSYTLKSLIDFMYKGQTYVNQTGLKDLVESAELLQVTGLYDSQTQIREYFGDDENSLEKEGGQQSEMIQYKTKSLEKEDHSNTDSLMGLDEANNESDSTRIDCESNPRIVDVTEINYGKEVQTDYTELYNADLTSRPNVMCSTENNYNSSEQPQRSPEVITSSISTIRVKPTIKLINLFQLTGKPAINTQFQSPVKHIRSTSIPWTYIHVPTTEDNQTLTGSISTPEMSNKLPWSDLVSPDALQSEINPDNSNLPFLKFNSSSMAISVKNMQNKKTPTIVPAANMVMETEQETGIKFIGHDRDREKCEVHLKTEYDAVSDSREIELGDTLLSEADFPKFYAMIKKEKDEKARLAREKEISGTEPESIICQPNISYIYEDDDVGKDSGCGDNDTAVCIDYDRLVAETYGNDEIDENQKGKLIKQQKRKQSKFKKLENIESKCFTPYMPPAPKNLRGPPTLVPLSVMQPGLEPKHLYSIQNSSSKKDDKANLYKHRFDPGTKCFSNGEEPHSPQTVILRNPRCNQPRHYSTESLYSALMAVKHGESIYRASRLYQVPRKTLRNWMKRWDIKSQFPMPKQLKDAARKRKENQNT